MERRILQKLRIEVARRTEDELELVAGLALETGGHLLERELEVRGGGHGRHALRGCRRDGRGRHEAGGK